jgi:hypothetical protein
LEANQVEIIQRVRAAKRGRINEEEVKAGAKTDQLTANVHSMFFEQYFDQLCIMEHVALWKES